MTAEQAASLLAQIHAIVVLLGIVIGLLVGDMLFGRKR